MCSRFVEGPVEGNRHVPEIGEIIYREKIGTMELPMLEERSSDIITTIKLLVSGYIRR